MGPGSPSWAPPGSPSDALQQKVFFLAAMAIEIALLLGYGRSQYTGNWTNVINTTDLVRCVRKQDADVQSMKNEVASSQWPARPTRLPHTVSQTAPDTKAVSEAHQIPTVRSSSVPGHKSPDQERWLASLNKWKPKTKQWSSTLSSIKAAAVRPTASPSIRVSWVLEGGAGPLDPLHGRTVVPCLRIAEVTCSAGRKSTTYSWPSTTRGHFFHPASSIVNPVPERIDRFKRVAQRLVVPFVHRHTRLGSAPGVEQFP